MLSRLSKQAENKVFLIGKKLSIVSCFDVKWFLEVLVNWKGLFLNDYEVIVYFPYTPWIVTMG